MSQAGVQGRSGQEPGSAELLLPAERGFGLFFFFCAPGRAGQAGSTPVGLGGFGRRKGAAGRRDCIQAVWLDQSPRSRDGC